MGEQLVLVCDDDVKLLDKLGAYCEEEVVDRRSMSGDEHADSGDDAKAGALYELSSRIDALGLPPTLDRVTFFGHLSLDGYEVGLLTEARQAQAAVVPEQRAAS